MPITIQCPNPACGASSSVADSISGRNVRCKQCGAPFVARPTLDDVKGDTNPASPPGADPFPVLPAEFGRYRVLRLLGRGGMGSVHLAEDSHLGRQVALKFPAFGPGESPQRVERFVREARSAAVLQHPNVCTIHDAGQIDGRPFISMAFVDGKPLDALIDPDAPIPERRAADLARKVALALAHAHDRGIVHRDLKPANVMLGPGGEPVVMDFGLAKRVAEPDPHEAKLTRAGAVIGTPSYMAPEQVRGEVDRIGPATDVYALGVLLFEMLTGRPPYTGPLGVVMGQILHAPVPPASEFRPEVDPRLTEICRRAMAKDPADRFPDMTAFADALQECIDPEVSVVVEPVPAPAASEFASLGDGATSARRPHDRVGVKSSRPNRWVWAGAGLVGLLVLLAGVWLTVRTKHGAVVIELRDPKAKVEVAVDGDRIDVTVDRPLSLRAGEHGLTVTGADFETVAQAFTVKRAEKQVVRITLKPKPVVAKAPPRKEPVPGPGDVATPPTEVPPRPEPAPPAEPVTPAPSAAGPVAPSPAGEIAQPIPGRWLPLITSPDDVLPSARRVGRFAPDASATFANGALALRGCSNYVGPPRATDFLVRARVEQLPDRSGPGRNVSLIIHGGIQFQFSSTDDPRVGIFRIGRVNKSTFLVLAEDRQVRLAGNNRCEMALATHNNVVTGYVNGRRVASCTADLGPNGSGGAHVWNSHGVFRNLEVFILDGTGLSPADALNR